VNKKHSQLLCYALVISIILVLTGFLAVGVRAFESAEISNLVFFAGIALFALTPVFYFVWRPIGRADMSQKVFEGARQEMWFGRNRRKPGLNGQEKMVITVERRNKQRSMPLTAPSE
jgi:hypothetical protein